MSQFVQARNELYALTCRHTQRYWILVIQRWLSFWSLSTIVFNSVDYLVKLLWHSDVVLDATRHRNNVLVTQWTIVQPDNSVPEQKLHLILNFVYLETRSKEHWEGVLDTDSETDLDTKVPYYPYQYLSINTSSILLLWKRANTQSTRTDLLECYRWAIGKAIPSKPGRRRRKLQCCFQQAPFQDRIVGEIEQKRLRISSKAPTPNQVYRAL
jgi:hypothetical protein